MPKPTRHFRFANDADELLSRVADLSGITRTAILEGLIRAHVKVAGIYPNGFQLDGIKVAGQPEVKMPAKAVREAQETPPKPSRFQSFPKPGKK